MIKSLAFPKMFSSSSIKVFSELDAVKSNLKLTLLSERTSLFGDPLFGTNLKKIIHSHNDPILFDRIVDEIYSSIIMFMPELRLSREDIQLYQDEYDKTRIYAEIKALNVVGYTTDLYTVELLQDEH